MHFLLIGVTSFTIDLPEKKVTVETDLPVETVLEELKKCGKETVLVTESS